MRFIKPFLLLGLIFALICSVSFAASPPFKATLTEFKKDATVSIDQVITPAITIKISGYSFDDLRQHRSESFDFSNIYTEKKLSQAPAAAEFNYFNYILPVNLYGEINKNYTAVLRWPAHNINTKIIVHRQLPQKNITPPIMASCNKRE